MTSGEADKLQFQILSADGLRITSIFSINSRTGAIFTNAMIDREQICERSPVCQLEFDVTVKSDVNFVRLLTVRIIVGDINDNAPTFPKEEITLSVPESAPLDSEIPISGALDRDSGLNATIRYSLQVSSVFGLKEVKQLDGSSALKLLVQRTLDREAADSYSFLILASDGQGPDSRTGTLTVNVQVTDVNDNVPKFTKDAFNMTVMETAPVGTVFGHLTASDGDAGDNGDLSYRFSLLTQSDVTDLFSLNDTSGDLVVTGGLQYQSGRMFQCVVEVMDHGVPPQVSQAILRIHVADAGNTPPKLDLTLADPVFGDQSAMLYEDVQPGTFVGTLKVEDLDEGEEGEVNCSSVNPHFSLQDLDTKRYGIVVSKMLDREEMQEMSVTLLCSDRGAPRLTSSTVFSVIVRDVNDNAPEFTMRVYLALVTENAAGEQSVARVLAVDRDDSTNSAITYSLDSQGGQFFTVDPISGFISTQNSFDREMTPVVSLTVYATDSGRPALTGTATVSVTVSDVNDNAPYVNRTDYYVSEGNPLGHVMDIQVADEDAGMNGTVFVSPLDRSVSALTPFEVFPNGSVSIRTMLDREQKAVYTLAVILKDGGVPPLSSTATLTLHVVDNNDHSPTFTFPTPDNSSVHVVAEIPVGTTLCQVAATDSDMGNNGHVIYTITDGNHDQWFAINNQSGELFLIKDLAHVAGSTLHLTLAASDMGTPPLAAHTFLDIFVRATNASYLADLDTADQDRYIVIAGVIAGVTFVVAVVVVAVIIHMRNSDLRRRGGAVRGKESSSEECSGGNAKSVAVACKNQVVASNAGGGRKSSGVTAVDDSFAGLCGHDLSSLENGGFEPHSSPSKSRNHKDPAGVLTEEALDQFNPAFSLFPEARNGLVGEDHNSDTSGETTTCDSGRGASDEEIVYPLAGATGHKDPPPRIPPREPLSTTAQWSRDARVVSTNWLHFDQQNYVTDESLRYVTEDAFDTDTSCSPAGDFRAKARKGPLRVRFSFDNGDARSQNSLVPHGSDNRGFSPDEVREHDFMTGKNVGFDSNEQPYISSQNRREESLSKAASYPNGQKQSVLDYYNPHSKDFRFRDENTENGVNHHKEMRLNPESMYPRHERFPRKQGTQSSLPGWDRQQGKTRNSESLTSLPQSVDDDVSTTTSGSYSIDFEDALNVSLEC
ncbi:protocadherin gamma-B5-like [Littorina saxatilis]|uniref:protocadherin gamma-B5-like n=1 Tax=Littorina saxatilis TaxID=31220 RepID=UPI0038B6091E